MTECACPLVSSLTLVAAPSAPRSVTMPHSRPGVSTVTLGLGIRQRAIGRVSVTRSR